MVYTNKFLISLFLTIAFFQSHAIENEIDLSDQEQAQTRLSTRLKTTFKRDSKNALSYAGFITITNDSSQDMFSWQTVFCLNEGQTLGALSNALLVEIDGQKVTVKNRPRNGTLIPGQKVAIGIEVNNPKKSNSQIKHLCTLGKPIIEQSGSSRFSLFATSRVINQTELSYNLEIELVNKGTGPTASWQVGFSLPVGQSIVNLSDGTFKQTGNSVTLFNSETLGAGIIQARENKIITLHIIKSASSPAKINNLLAVGNGNLQNVLAPAAPILNAIVVDPNQQSSFVVSWSTSFDATSYVLQQDISSSFNNPRVVAEGYQHSQIYVNQPNGTYYFRVAAINANGNSPWSNVQSVTVNLPPVVLTAPVLQPINNPMGANSFSLNWSAVTNAQGYNVEESQDPNFGTFSTVFSGIDTTVPVTGLANGTYYYRVSATASNSVGPESNVESTVITQGPISNTPIIDGYWESWDGNATPAQIVGMKCDVINISFANFTSLGNHQFQVAGVQADPATLAQLVSLAHAANKKVKVSVGGATYPLQPQLQTTADAVGMAQAVQQYVTANNLDGVDLDIEDQTPASLQVVFIQNLRQLMPSKLITLAPETPAATSAQWDMVIQNGYQYMSYISIQDYNNYQGYSYQQDLAALMAFGVKAQQLNVGLMPGDDNEGVPTSLADITSIAEYVQANGFKGVMFWDLNRDFENLTGLGPSAATNTAWNVFH